MFHALKITSKVKSHELPPSPPPTPTHFYYNKVIKEGLRIGEQLVSINLKPLHIVLFIIF